MDGIAAPVRFAGRRIERHARRFPWLLPWRNAVFEHLDDGVGNFLTVIAFYGGGHWIARAESLTEALLRRTFVCLKSTRRDLGFEAGSFEQLAVKFLDGGFGWFSAIH